MRLQEYLREGDESDSNFMPIQNGNCFFDVTR